MSNVGPQVVKDGVHNRLQQNHDASSGIMNNERSRDNKNMKGNIVRTSKAGLELHFYHSPLNWKA